MQMLTLLEASAPAAEPEDAWLHRMIGRPSLAFADRAQYLADLPLPRPWRRLEPARA